MFWYVDSARSLGIPMLSTIALRELRSDSRSSFSACNFLNSSSSIHTEKCVWKELISVFEQSKSPPLDGAFLYAKYLIHQVAIQTE